MAKEPSPNIDSYLVVFGELYEPSYISELLGIEPSHTTTAGVQVIHSGEETGLIAKSNSWIFKLPLPEKSGVEEHLGALKVLLREKAILFGRFDYASTEVRIDLVVRFGSLAAESFEGISLDRELIHLLDSVGASIEIEFRLE